MIKPNFASDLWPSLRSLRALTVALFALLVVAGCSSAATSGGPSIGTQPAAVSVPEGAVASFTVAAAGDPSLAYQWRRDGVDLADGAGITGATTAALALTAQLAWTGSQISVRVSNGGGDVLSSDALLTVTASASAPPGTTPGPVDGTGKAWGPPALLSSGALDGSPGRGDVAIDGKGDAVAVWVEKKGPRNAVFASLCPAGGKWSTGASIDSGAGSSSDPRIAITASGKAVAGYSETSSLVGGLSRTWAARFDGAWIAPTAVDANNGSPSEDHRIALAPDGSALMSFLQSDGTLPRISVTSSATWATWSSATVLDVAGGVSPEITIAANGHAVATWLKPQGPAADVLWTSRVAGAGWTPPVTLAPDTGKVGRSIRVAADATGNTMAVWSQVLGGRLTVRAARLDDTTGAWSAPVSLSSGQRDTSSEDIAADAKGNAVVVWHEEADGVFANRYTASTATWSGPVNIGPKATPPSVSSQPKVGLDGKGNAIAVWLQVPTDAPGKRIYAAQLASGATSWGAPFDLMTEPTAYTTEPARLAVNVEGQATVVWYQVVDSPPAVGVWARGYR